jgi:hypothetical protein
VIPYSSLTAFLAHYRALKSSHSPSAKERSLLAEMHDLITPVWPEIDRDNSFLWADSGSESGEIKRRVERAERELRRELLVRGVLTG